MSERQDEVERIAALRSYRILDTPPEPAFDEIVLEAASVFSVPMAVLSMIDEDRQWHKARIGVPCTETARATSFCTHTIRSAAMFVVQDASNDPRFADNPFVVGDPYFRFYAGTTLTTRDGYRIGTLCVMDSVVHAAPTAAQRGSLAALADRAMITLEERKKRLANAN